MNPSLIELTGLLQPPAKDTVMVLFADDTLRGTKSDSHKHLQQCTAYAKQYKVYLVTGLFVHDENLCLCLIGPSGELLCRQGASQLSERLSAKLRPSLTQYVTQTPLGAIALCVDADIYFPQVLRTVARKGADIVISIQQVQEDIDPSVRLKATVWNAAQTNNLYVVNLSANGCVVACPAAVTRNRDGYLVRRTSIVPIRFGLSLQKLAEVRARVPIMEALNTDLIKTHEEALGRW